MSEYSEPLPAAGLVARLNVNYELKVHVQEGLHGKIIPRVVTLSKIYRMWYDPSYQAGRLTTKVYYPLSRTEDQHWYFRLVIPDIEHYRLRSLLTFTANLYRTIRDTLTHRLDDFVDAVMPNCTSAASLEIFDESEITSINTVVGFTLHVHVLNIRATGHDLQETTELFSRFLAATDSLRFRTDEISFVNHTTGRSFIDTTPLPTLLALRRPLFLDDFKPTPLRPSQVQQHRAVSTPSDALRRETRKRLLYSIPSINTFPPEDVSVGKARLDDFLKLLTDCTSLQKLTHNHQGVIRIAVMQLERLQALRRGGATDAIRNELKADYRRWVANYDLVDSVYQAESNSFMPEMQDEWVLVKASRLHELERDYDVLPLPIIRQHSLARYVSDTTVVQEEEDTPAFVPPFDPYNDLVVLEMPIDSDSDVSEAETVPSTEIAIHVDVDSDAETTPASPAFEAETEVASPSSTYRSSPYHTLSLQLSGSSELSLTQGVEFDLDTIPPTPQSPSSPDGSDMEIEDIDETPIQLEDEDYIDLP